MKKERGKGWQGMAQIKQCTKRGDEHTEGRRGRGRQEGWTEEGTEREEGWLVLTPVIALMTSSDWLVCGVCSGGWEAR